VSVGRGLERGLERGLSRLSERESRINSRCASRIRVSRCASRINVSLRKSVSGRGLPSRMTISFPLGLVIFNPSVRGLGSRLMSRGLPSRGVRGLLRNSSTLGDNAT
jgi:hypothetical protein